MEERNTNCAVKVAYGFMHFLGSVTRHVRDGFYSVAPFMKPKEFTNETNLATEQTIKTDERKTTLFAPKQDIESLPEEKPVVKEIKPVIVQTPPRQEKKPDPIVEEIVQKPIDPHLILKNTVYENEDEEIRAEIYVRDFISPMSNTNVRNDSLEQIKRLSTPVAIEVLMNLLKSSTEKLRTLEVLNSLTSLNEDNLIDKNVFLPYINHDAPALRSASLRAISRYKDEDSYLILVSSLKDTEADIRKQTLNLLSWSFGLKPSHLYLKSLHDVDSQVAKTAALICGALKIKESISSLITLLSDPEKDVQKAAVESLRKITEQKYSFSLNGSESSKKMAIESWRFWWRDNQTKFLSQNKLNTESTLGT